MTLPYPILSTGGIRLFEITIARRYITARRRQTALSITAVALAVSISLIFSSLANGQQAILTDLVAEKLPHVTVSPQQGDDYIHLYHTLAEKISSLPGIRARASSLSTTCTLSLKDRTKNGLLKGTDADDIDAIYQITDSLVAGDLDSIKQSRNAVLGLALAKELEGKLGDKLQATFPRARATELTVTGIFESGTPLDETLVLVSPETARNFLDEGDVINAVEIKLEDIYQADSVADELTRQGYNAQSWIKTNPEIMRAIRIGGFWTRFSVLLFMVIAFFGIASIMNLMVAEKTREIGMLMALGARRSSIRRIFLVESGILGLIGSALGCLVGVAGVLSFGQVHFEIAAGGREITTLPLMINPWDFLLLSALAVALSVIAAVYPARNASRMDPVMALRGG
ncbi:MAG: ABC transporter permease [Methanothrix sp.]|nr:ABC transporter permease [Methanothrix sp.]